MSILDKPLISEPPRRRRWPYFVLGLLLVLLLLFFWFTNPANDVAFVQHFFSAPAHFTYSGHKDYVSSVAWSPDSRSIAVGESSGNVSIWDIASGKNIFTYGGHTSDVYAVAWSPNGQRIASGSNDATVQVWDALSGRHAYVYRGHADIYPGHFTTNGAVNAVAWSPDSTHIASGSSDNTVQVWPDLRRTI